MKRNKTPDWIHYIVGHLRYWLYYNMKWVMREHILEQINYRINSMDKICFNNGSCKECGCKTLHLQMCNKACEGFCYPAMLSKEIWEFWSSSPNHSVDVGSRHVFWSLDSKNRKFIKYGK